MQIKPYTFPEDGFDLEKSFCCLFLKQSWMGLFTNRFSAKICFPLLRNSFSALHTLRLVDFTRFLGCVLFPGMGQEKGPVAQRSGEEEAAVGELGLWNFPILPSFPPGKRRAPHSLFCVQHFCVRCSLVLIVSRAAISLCV